MGSQHAHAMRLATVASDHDAFMTQPFRYDRYMLAYQQRAGVLGVEETIPDAARTWHPVEAVIGITPLRQYLVPYAGGRLQVLNISYDPEKREWFNAQDEVRFAQDWSFWTNRGMTWNTMCAFCHMTGLKENYDPSTDSYKTTWDEMGVSCMQCHVAAAKPATNGCPVSGGPKMAPERTLHNCASCHARREKLTSTFKPGEYFHDHFRVTLADLDAYFWQDGQVHDEDFEFSSFLMSRMGGAKGIVCVDCHDPHTAKTKAPAANNALCLTCHTPPGQRQAKPIDLLTHSHHKPGTVGDACIDCHMPTNIYMMRDPRRDHGFTIPDPVLTKELGLPNACNRCHTTNSVEWAAEWTAKWYGDKMERPSRQRARVVARAQHFDPAAVPDLLKLEPVEEIPAWRAILVSLLGAWAGRDDVRAALERALADSDPMVRAAAVRGLAPLHSEFDRLIPYRRDPVRLVRLEAAWATMNEVEHEPVSYNEFQDYLQAISDQPAGALRQSQFAMAENRMADAEKWARQTAAWDKGSAAAQEFLGQVLNLVGKTGEAEAALNAACHLEPTNAAHAYTLALFLGEHNRLPETVRELQRAVKLDPSFGRAWYNLGLAQAQLEQLDAAAESLRAACRTQPDSSEPPYALATVELRRNRKTEAVEAARKALKISPGFQPALDLLKQAGSPSATK